MNAGEHGEHGELRTKLEHAEQWLRDAEDVRARLAGALAAETPPLQGWERDRLTVELHTADVRLDLWRNVVAELRGQLGLR